MPIAKVQQSVYSHDMLDEVDGKLVGSFRPSGPKNNTLLTRPQLGTVRSTTYSLPSAIDFQHEYGLRQERDGITSNDVLGGWAESEGTGGLQPPRDFKALNKMAAMANCKSTKDVQVFRRSNDARLKLGTDKKPEILPYDEMTVFGKSTSASENFNDLISHMHRYEWCDSKPSAAEMVEAAKPKGPSQTKTSILAAKTAREKLEAMDKPAGPVEQWKMACFKKVPPKLGPLGE